MSCPESGATQESGAPNGWRDRCLRDTPRLPHATAREYASKGSYRNSLRDPNDLPWQTTDRPAKLNRTPARAADAAPGAVDSMLFPPTTDAPARHPGPAGSFVVGSAARSGSQAVAPRSSAPGCMRMRRQTETRGVERKGSRERHRRHPVKALTRLLRWRCGPGG